MFQSVKNKGVITFVVILFLCSLFYSSVVLDYTLTPRFFLLSLMLCCFFIVYKFKIQIIEITIVHLCFVAFGLLNFLSWFWALNPVETWFVSIKTMCSIIVFFCSVYFFKKQQNAMKIIYIIVALLCSVALIVSFIQLHEISLFDIKFENNENPIYYVTSVSSHKNLVSSFLYILFPFLIIAYFKSKKAPLLWIILFALTFILLIELKTRAVLIALILAIISFSVFCFYLKYILESSKWKKILFSIFVISIVLILISIGFYHIHKLNKLTIANTDSFIERILIWMNTLKMIYEHFWFGVGGGNWQIFFPKYSLNGIWRCDEMNVTFQRPHNDFLWIWSEFGIVGLILKMLVLIGVMFPAFKTLRNRNESLPKRYEIAFVLSFYIAGSIIIAFDFPMERAEHTIWISVVMAYLYATSDNYFKTIITIKYSRWINVFASLLLLFSTYVCYLKMKGEYCTKKLYVAKENGDYNGVIKNCFYAESFVYSLDPVSMPLRWYSGNAYMSLHQFDDGMHCLKKAYKQHPYNRYILNDLGTAYAIKKDYKTAEKLYITAAKISRRYDDATLNLITLYIQTNQLDNACGWDTLLCHESQRRTYLKSLFDK